MSGDITFRGTDLDTDNICLDLVKGYPAIPDVRGGDDVMPEAAGRYPGDWIADRTLLQLAGYVKGTGATLADRRASFRTAIDALAVLLDRTTAGDIVLTAPYLGIAAGTKTISARPVNSMGGPIESWRSHPLQRWSIELESISSPPEWT